MCGPAYNAKGGKYRAEVAVFDASAVLKGLIIVVIFYFIYLFIYL